MNNTKPIIIKFFKNNLISRIKSKLNAAYLKFFPIKLGASYSVWDGEELLESSVKLIRPHCDYINVVWQKVSWKGEPCNDNLESLLLDLKSKGLIDEIILFEPNLKLKTQQNELNKRNLGLNAAKKQNCTHFMTIDTDEFYKPDEFKAAKDFIIKHNITHSFCNIYNYYTQNYREADVAKYFVPFIYKINKFTKFKLNAFSFMPFLVDPTRQIPIKQYKKICMLSMICMHHFSFFRINLEKKYRNTSAEINAEKKAAFLQMTNPSNLEALKEAGKIIFVKDNFNININNSGN